MVKDPRRDRVILCGGDSFTPFERRRGLGFANASDFVRTLIREDRERQAKKQLELLLLEGVRSGEAEEATDAYWDALKAQIRETVSSEPAER